MYDQNSVNQMLYMQKKQMMWMFAMIFAVMVTAITFSAFLINNMVNSRVASAQDMNATPTVVVQPAAVTTGDSCVEPSGGQGGGAEAAAISAHIGGMGGGSVLGASTGGRGGGVSAAGGSTVHYTITKSFSRNVNSGNTIGSNNGNGNIATTNNTQGSYNDVEGDLQQLNLAKNEAENENKTIVKDSANTTDSNNNEIEIKDSGNDNSSTSDNDITTTNTVNSNNTLELSALPYVTAESETL